LTVIDPTRLDWEAVPTAGEPSARLDRDAAERSPHEWTGTLVAIAPDEFRGPLRTASAERPIDLTVRERATTGTEGDPYDVRAVVGDEPAPDAILVVVPPDRPLAAVVPAPVVDGVPVGVLPAEDPDAVRGWLDAVAGGPSPVPAWAVLAMGTDRYLVPAGDLCVRLSTGATPQRVAVHDWRANLIDRPTLCASLAAGPSLCVYLGHGTPEGWGGYQRCTWSHVAAAERVAPAGAILSLACGTLRDGDGTPFGVRFVRSGRARAFLGWPADVPVDAVRALGDALGDALVDDPPATVGELLTTLRVRRGDALGTARLVGLPTQPLY
jgi:hypothetical protein